MDKLRVEARELWTSGFREYFGTGGAFLFENTCSLLHCLSVLCAVLARVVFGTADIHMENLSLLVVCFALVSALPPPVDIFDSVEYSRVESGIHTHPSLTVANGLRMQPLHCF